MTQTVNVRVTQGAGLFNQKWRETPRLKGLRSTPFEKEGGALVPTGALLAALTNALRNEGWQSPIGLLGF